MTELDFLSDAAMGLQLQIFMPGSDFSATLPFSAQRRYSIHAQRTLFSFTACGANDAEIPDHFTLQQGIWIEHDKVRPRFRHLRVSTFRVVIQVFSGSRAAAIVAQEFFQDVGLSRRRQLKWMQSAYRKWLRLKRRQVRAVSKVRFAIHLRPLRAFYSLCACMCRWSADVRVQIGVRSVRPGAEPKCCASSSEQGAVKQSWCEPSRYLHFSTSLGAIVLLCCRLVRLRG